MRMSSPARSTPSRLLALLIAGACALTSCGDDDDAPPDPPSSSPTTTSPEAEVESAYLAYWDMVDRLLADPDPTSKEIAERAVDPVKRALIESLRELRESGRSLRGGQQVAHDIGDVTVTGNDATLKDCAIDDSISLDSTGSTVDRRLATDHLEVTLVRQQDSWQIKAIDVLESWDGAVECAP